MRLAGDGPGLPPMGLGCAQGVVPISGSARLLHLAEDLGALEVRLSPADLAGLDRAAPLGAPVGDHTSPTGTEQSAP